MLEQSRRDDLESLANVMVFLKKGKLPWFRRLNVRMSRLKRYEYIKKIKLQTQIEEITSGLPEELKDFYIYCRKGIDFYERPDYGYLKNLLHTLIHKELFQNVLCFQWQIDDDPQLVQVQDMLMNYK